MRFPILFFTITMIFILGCSGSVIGVEKTKSFQQQLPYRQENKLVVKNVNGSIDIKAQERSEFSTVTATLKATGLTQTDAQELLEKIEIRFAREGDEIHIETVYPKIWTMPGKAKKPKSWSVNYKIIIPDKLDVECSNTNGDVDVNGLNARVTASTTNGNIFVDGNTNEVVAGTVNGNTEVRNSQDYKIVVRASTQNGNNVLDMPRARQGKFYIYSTNGNVKLNLPSGVDPTIDLGTTNGNVDIYLGMRLSAKVDVQTTNGKAITNMVVNTSTSVGGILEDKVIRGVVGGGFGDIKAKTKNGNITLNYGEAPPEEKTESGNEESKPIET